MKKQKNSTSGSKTKFLQVIKNEPLRFISNLIIINKNGKRVKLQPNAEQIKIISALEEGGDTLVCKGRQIGSSTIISAYLFWKAYVADEPETYAILSHKMGSSKHLLKMHKTFYDNLPTSLKRELAVDNTMELRFADTGAGIIAASAGGEGGLRSFTCTALHMSEYAFSPNPEELKATAISALNNGQLIIESTANHFNDALHQEVMKYDRGEASWNYLFFPWFEHEEYQQDLPPGVAWTESEIDERGRWGLTDEQLYWRRLKIEKIGRDKFKREYPADINDAYAISGNTWLRADDFNNIEVLRVDPTELVTFQKPQAGESYAIGVDTSGGVGGDNAVIYVINKRTMQPAAIWRSNLVPPTGQAEMAVNLGTSYNNALVLVESNNYGHVVINEMKHQGYHKLWKDDSGGDWTTTVKTKTEMFERLKDHIQKCVIRQVDNITYSELRAITITERGLIQLPEQMSTHADSAVAMALAYTCAEKVILRQNAYLPDWVVTNRAQRITKNAGASVGRSRRY